MAATKKRKEVTPDLRPITRLQAERLAAIAGLSADETKEITGLNVVELSEKLKWRVEPELFLFRRVCGQVVKRDPATGALYPVPFATVHVEDTDCSLLGFFPAGWPWSWFFPLNCKREVIATAVTDACGRFCVYVPRWEVDWILRWRRERICFPIIFRKPLIRDILEELELLPEPPIIRPPRPEPDPVPFLLNDGGLTLRRAEQLVGSKAAGQLAALEATAMLGENTALREDILNAPALPEPLPPPLPAQLTRTGDKQEVAALASQVKLNRQLLNRFDPQRYIGPFWRCHDVFIPEFVPILDVPDITFRVTQDVDGDGDQETIYAEGFFDVRWNAGPIPDVVLEASPIAVAGPVCDTPDVPCEDTPAILFAGRLPLVNPAAPEDPYHDNGSGYGRRPNRPHPSGSISPTPADLPLPLAEAPYTRVLQLYGCNQAEGAQFYRLRYSFNGGPQASFTGLTWPLWRVVSGTLQSLWPTADANGWYPILPDSEGWFPSNLLLDWPTNSFANGLYTITLELGNAAKSVINTSAPVSFRTDNSQPTAQFTELRWRVAGGVWSPPLSLVCPVISRPTAGGAPLDIEIRLSYQAAATHLRSVVLSGGGCGGGNPTLVSPTATAQHWHTTPADNSVINTATFALPGALAQGAYSFSLFVASRAFNPAGGDGGHLADWNYNPVYNWIHPRLSIAVVNA